MQKKTHAFAFTLAEVMVAIAIISIIALGISQVDFNRMSQEQEVAIEAVEISGIIREIRNNAFLGRGVGDDLLIPEYWQIDITGDVLGEQVRGGYIDGGLQNTHAWTGIKTYQIFDIFCYTIDKSSSVNTSSVSLEFRGGNIDIINGCSGLDRPQIIEFQLGNTDISKYISINTLTSVIETR